MTDIKWSLEERDSERQKLQEQLAAKDAEIERITWERDDFKCAADNLSMFAQEAIRQRDMLKEALKPFAKLYIGVSMNDDAVAAWTVIGDRETGGTSITAGDIRAARAAIATLDQPAEGESRD